MRKILLGLFLLATTARAEPGLDLLGLQHPKFPVKDTVELLPDGFVGGNLDWTFGTSLAPVKRILVTGKVKLWRVHFFNGPGLRNRQLGSYEPHFKYSITTFSKAWENREPTLRNHLKTRVRAYCKLFAEFPIVTLEMSPTLEHNLSHKAFREQRRVVLANCPAAIVIDNPVGGVPFTIGKQEKHGTTPAVKAPCNVSLDGDSAEDVDVVAFLKRFAKCEAAYIWSRALNGRLASGDFVDPRARDAWPSRDHLRALFRYLQPVTLPALAQCVAVPSSRLWKPFADDKGIGDVRANKPMWISPFFADAVTVHDVDDGKEVASLSYFGPFDGGGHRYYSGSGSNLTSMQMADRSEYVYLREGASCFGPFHPAYRQGRFR
jgi:hypothetical protein